MTQLSLFADLALNSATAAVVVPIPPSSAAQKSGTAKAPQQDTLMKLAELIRQGRDQMEAQSRRRNRPVQSIGDLAQAVLMRHDLVARRRAASRQATSRQATSRQAASRQPDSLHTASLRDASLRDAAGQANLADTPSEVHVAS